MAGVALQEVKELVDGLTPRLVELRHDLHRHPQLAFEETYASERVQDWLRDIGVPFEAGVAKTGVVAWLTPSNGGSDAPAIALRADMDALPIHEQTGLPWASEHPGCMHACGHDGHTTMLLGAAAVLMKLRDRLVRPVKFIFQPAEERLGGAAKMVAAGALDERIAGIGASEIFGMHGWPGLPLHAVGTREGAFMASTGTFDITIRGRGGHGAAPHATADPIVAAAHVVTALQSIVARNVDPAEPAVISVGALHAGDVENVIPDEARLLGTLRALNESTALMLRERITTVATQVAVALGCQAQVVMEEGYPGVVNHPAATRQVYAAAEAVVGDDLVRHLNRPLMVAEDFAYYGQKVPAAFFLLGLGLEKPGAGLHTPRFDFSDAVIGTGVRLFCELALQGEHSEG